MALKGADFIKFDKAKELDREDELIYATQLETQKQLAELSQEVKKKEEVVEPVKGDTGPEGAPGTPGSEGEPGAEGAPGAAGSDGEPGTSGKDGKDGNNGKDGQNGAQGSPGLPGKAPEHEWEETSLKIKQPDGSWGELVDLKGLDGLHGRDGGGGGIRISKNSGVLVSSVAKGYNFTTAINANVNTSTGLVDVSVDSVVLDGTYLRLDTSNDPLTGALNIEVTADEAFVVSDAAGANDYFTVDTNTTNLGLLKITDDVLGGDFLSVRGDDHGMELKATTVDTAIANMNHNTWQLDIDNTATNNAVYRGLLYNLNLNNNFNVTGSLQGVFFACLNNGTGTITTSDANTSFIFNVSTGIMTDVHGFNAVMGSLGGTVTRYTAFHVGGSIGTLALAAVLGEADARFRTSSAFHYNRGGTLKYVTFSDQPDGITLDSLDVTVETTTSGDINLTSVDDINISADLIDVTGPLRTDAVRRQFTDVTTAAYTALVTDHHISIQYTNTAVQTTTFPAITATNHGQEYTVKDADGNAGINNITFNTTGGDTIDNSASGVAKISVNNHAYTFRANNTTSNWEII